MADESEVDKEVDELREWSAALGALSLVGSLSRRLFERLLKDPSEASSPELQPVIRGGATFGAALALYCGEQELKTEGPGKIEVVGRPHATRVEAYVDAISARRNSGKQIVIHSPECSISAGTCTCVPYVIQADDARDSHEIARAADAHHGKGDA